MKNVEKWVFRKALKMRIKKVANLYFDLQPSTRSGTRTHTAVRPLVPETSASTDSAIRACLEDCETVVCFSFAGAKIVIFHRISKF